MILVHILDIWLKYQILIVRLNLWKIYSKHMGKLNFQGKDSSNYLRIKQNCNLRFNNHIIIFKLFIMIGLL